MRGHQRVNCVLGVLHCTHAAIQSHTKQCAGADMQVLPPSEKTQ
ncbi:unnamed protein product, partial [Staurois parvus]